MANFFPEVNAQLQSLAMVVGAFRQVKSEPSVALTACMDPRVGTAKAAAGSLAADVKFRTRGRVLTTVARGTGLAHGIFFLTCGDCLAVNNRMTEAYYGIRYIGSTGKYRDNITSSVTGPYVGGTDIGNNN